MGVVVVVATFCPYNFLIRQNIYFFEEALKQVFNLLWPKITGCSRHGASPFL
jgi:hypothetical protein